MEKNDKIYVAGHAGMVGSALCRLLEKEAFTNIIYRERAQVDLTDQQAVTRFFNKEQPRYVFLAAAKVGGIWANNTFRAQFLYENLMIAANIIHAAHVSGVQKLLFLGSSCIYPALAPQPIKEEALLQAALEYANEPYAIAKIAGIKLCESYYKQYGSNFLSVMPTNLYGPNDNYQLDTSHVFPALIRKFYLAACLEKGDLKAIHEDFARHEGPVQGDATLLKHLENIGIVLDDSNLQGTSPSFPDQDSGKQVQVRLWGSGKPAREFLHVDDAAAACLHVMQEVNAASIYSSGISHLNVGCGNDLSINDLAELIKSCSGFSGRICWDNTKPDGTPRKLLDVSRLARLGWVSSIGLEEGIQQTVKDYASGKHKSKSIS